MRKLEVGYVEIAAASSKDGEGLVMVLRLNYAYTRKQMEFEA